MTVLPDPVVKRPRIQIDRVVAAMLFALLVLAMIDRAQVTPTITFTITALLSTAPFLIFAILAIGLLKATGSETVVARAFDGREKRMIVLASFIGGLSPFCSCEAIPFISALLIAGTPVSAVMAFWLASPLMDPAIFVLTSAELGWEFAIAKAIGAIGLGLTAGFVMHYASKLGAFQNMVIARETKSCCGTSRPFSGQPVWTFWRDKDRRAIFQETALSNGAFLLKWLALAYFIESLMIRYIPAETIVAVVGGDGVQPIILSAFIGAPAYLNGYAAPAIVSGLMDQGMGMGAAMTFMIAGGVTSIPAMTAVFVLVKRQLFAAYLTLGIVGAIIIGLLFQASLTVFV
jgi:hypothetical protein